MVKHYLKYLFFGLIISLLFLLFFSWFIKTATAAIHPAGGGITLREGDSSPSGQFNIIIVTNGSLTDNGDNSATLEFSSGGSGGGAPTDATYITQTSNATLTNEQALSGLATGLLKNTTGTGVLSIATADTDYLVTLAKDLVTTAPVTGGTDNILPGADSDITIALNYSTDMLLLDGSNKLAVGYNSADFSVAGSSFSVVAGMTRDTEWDTISEINTATTDADIIATNSAWSGGDLGGTGLAATVTDDSHNHTSTTISGVDISADTNLSATNPVVLTGDVLSLNYATTNLLLDGDGKLSVGYNSNHFSVAGSSMSIVTDGVDDTLIDWGSGANQVDLADIPGGIAGASAFDFGGSTSVEVPNGTSPTVNAAGEIAVDTSATTGAGIRYYADAEYFVPAYLSKSFVLANPSSGSDYKIWKVPQAITIKNIHVLCTGGDQIIGGLDEADANGANASAVDSDITALVGVNTNDDGSLSNPTIDATDYINWHTTSTSSSPASVTVTFDYIITP